MSPILSQKVERPNIGLLNGPVPSEIYHRSESPCLYGDRTGVDEASCIGCYFPRCMRFAPEELLLSDSSLSSFAVDADNSVCPVNAITWERDALTPTINSDLCINCGICARRCPTGAIYSNGEHAVINDNTRTISSMPITPLSIAQQEEQIRGFLAASHKGQYLSLDTGLVAKLYEKLDTLQTDAQFPNLIVRNMFIVLGNKCAMSRRGDVYFRIDALLDEQPLTGVLEIEFGRDTLETPRAILDDVAVLSSRYEIDKNRIVPIIVTLEFPNLRTEYWRVIKDIARILKVRVNSLTLGALTLLVWSFKEVPITSLSFYADIDNPSIYSQLEELLGDIELKRGQEYAIVEPKK